MEIGSLLCMDPNSTYMKSNRVQHKICSYPDVAEQVEIIIIYTSHGMYLLVLQYLFTRQEV